MSWTPPWRRHSCLQRRDSSRRFWADDRSQWVEKSLDPAGTSACATIVIILLLTGILLAQTPKKEEPVGLVLTPGGAKILRAGVETPLAAKPGDILFSGDAMKTDSA